MLQEKDNFDLLFEFHPDDQNSKYCGDRQDLAIVLQFHSPAEYLGANFKMFSVNNVDKLDLGLGKRFNGERLAMENVSSWGNYLMDHIHFRLLFYLKIVHFSHIIANLCSLLSR